MRRVSAFAALSVALSIGAASTAFAQDATPPPETAPQTTPETSSETSSERRPIGLEEFRALVDGKTVYYATPDGVPIGREYFPPGRNSAVYVHVDGPCLNGTWRYAWPVFCFKYRQQPSCWSTYWDGDRIFVLSDDGQLQQITAIVENEPLVCNDLLSAAPRRLSGPPPG